MNREGLKDFFDKKVDEYNQPSFIENDPIFIPHQFSRKQDIEISGFFAAVFAWGNRKAIINKSKELMHLLHNAPYEFCINHSDADLASLEHFRHRTFTYTDLLYFLEFLKFHYTNHDSLESAFTRGLKVTDENIENSLNGFYQYFFSLEYIPDRTRKHIASPQRGSTCKRMNMFLRWMVRSDNKGVDFGIWKQISPAQLVCPIDLHVARVTRQFNILQRKQTDWDAAIELTNYLKTFDPEDPVRYDYALFALGVAEKFG
jgi:uncharacterized protein (TIGR02757 family)